MAFDFRTVDIRDIEGNEFVGVFAEFSNLLFYFLLNNIIK